MTSWRNDHGREIDPIHVRLRGERARNIGLGNDAVLDQNIDDAGRAVQSRLARFSICERVTSPTSSRTLST